MEECGLYLGRQRVGVLRWEQRQERLWLEAKCPGAPEWIYRLVVQTEEQVHRLGVMLPEKDTFVLRRELPAGQVPLCAAIDRSRPGESHLPGLPLAASAFCPAAEEGRRLSAEEGTELRCADLLHMRYLLFPLRLGGPCSLAHYFCLTTAIEGPEGLCGVFCKPEGADYCPLPTETDTLRSRNALC